ncbi:alpha/beta hydrolase [Halalkalicoccus jeotgali]|uniref:Alpha/beta hydrolase fold-3 domain protein n=1 Tax=Halalkalicoccus jeotgali (strain DSM 18796 / CECT 7217 / JCM 14584 / KCTC 4019 / B3) TaxID=795797 RepID=D8J6H4_HALJB|nr:alpha/beta hydrolase [Halalkalicoccus jeotgali]ADJ13851.1 Alpha/beta hydrolase fold-3 domain protein [Halalkalicoccus jeotgali B3]ELY34103.1 alpha/beta hydrolase fold-3 domain-containing protein [Halalkalicoccus jeotgali B3]
MATELHPQAEELLHDLSASGVPPLYRQSVAEARDTYLELTVTDGEPEPVERVLETAFEGPNGSVPVRAYDPGDDGETPRSALVFYHGGGWVVGDLDTHDLAARALANAAGCVVVSVDYRRAPEHPFPAALEDCYGALEWFADDPDLGVAIDPGRIAVGGDSAGGTLAAGVALLARDRDGPDIARQLLAYPVTDHAFDTDSYTENASGYFITRGDMERFWNEYLEVDFDGAHPYVSPLCVSDLAGVAPATVLTAGFDPLRDEGRAYADRLENAGVPVTRLEYPDMIHGFLTMLADPEWDRAREAIDALANDLRDLGD